MSKIRQLREEKGMTQRELAGAVGVSQPTVCDWENGKIIPELAKAIRLADLFDVSLDVIYGRAMEPPYIPAAGK